MNMNPVVSVIIPTLNRASILPRAIGSVLAQTFSQWELIIVDDGSTDTTDEVLALYKEDPRITIYRHTENQGTSVARNTGITHSSGRYIAFLDSDDVWEPTKLEKQVDVLERKDASVGLVYSGAKFIEADTKRVRIKHANAEGDIFLDEIAYNPIGSPSRVMIRRQCIEKVGVFDILFKSHEDWDLWIRIAKQYSCACIDEPLVQYVQQGDSVSVDPDKVIHGYTKLWEKHKILSYAPRIRALHYARLGHRLCYYRAMRSGRNYLWKAIVLQPWNVIYSILFFLSLFGSTVYRSVVFLGLKYI